MREASAWYRIRSGYKYDEDRRVSSKTESVNIPSLATARDKWIDLRRASYSQFDCLGLCQQRYAAGKDTRGSNHDD